MKAWVLKEQRKIKEKPLKLVEIAPSYPRENEVRIKVIVCGVCRTDIHIAEGDLPLRKTNLILGHEIVGVVDEIGKNVKKFKIGDLTGVSWLNSTCGICKYCQAGNENYCPDFKCTGWDADGGFAEYLTVPEDSVLNLNDIKLEPADIAPLLCPGIAGYAALKLTGAKKGEKLGLYGFGPTAACVLEVAKYLGIEVYVSTRSPKNIEKAKKAGAVWAADSTKQKMPCRLERSIVFPPAGTLVERALQQLEIGGTLVLAPVSMSTIAIENYSDNFWGRDIKTLYNVKLSEGAEFLAIASKLRIKPERKIFPFEQLQKAMIAVRQGELAEANAVVSIWD